MSGPNVYGQALGKQHFTGNPLDRLSDIGKRFAALTNPDSELSLVVVAGREIVVRPVSAQGGNSSVQHELQALLLRLDDPELHLRQEEMQLCWRPSDDAAPLPFPLYLLGQDTGGRWTMALDISGQGKERFLEFLRAGCELDVVMRDLRVLLPGLSMDAAAMAGAAVALSQWHQTHLFCPRCGARTIPTESGSRRRCLGTGPGTALHKQYPRTDPVVIMLVESPDGGRALLGRSAKSTPGMYTCLSGFIDQCESIEEAVRREVMEEARISVGRVAILGTQPWPIGRWGSCELMIGCVAKAQSYEVLLNASEMEDCQWYDRAELEAALRMYDRAPATPLPEIQKRSWSTLGFFIPPPFAVAYHLISLWVSAPPGWLASETSPSGGEPSQQGASDTNAAAEVAAHGSNSEGAALATGTANSSL